MEKGEYTVEDLLSKKSDNLSDYERGLRVDRLIEEVVTFVDERCEEYEVDSKRIDCSEYAKDEGVLKLVFQRDKYSHILGLAYSHSTEFISVMKNQGESLLYSVSLRKKGSKSMLFQYELHPKIAYDGLVDVLSKMYRIHERMNNDL